MLMVVTLKSGAQIRVGVKDFEVRRGSVDGDLRTLNWTYDDNPVGTSLAWLDMSQVAAVHAEREPGDKGREVDAPARAIAKEDTR